MQPQSDQYGIDQLYSKPRFTRATYTDATGQQAPPFQADQPIKRWFLTVAELGGHGPSDFFVYRYFDAQQGQYRTNVISYDLASKVNLPGATTYPKYVIAPTGAVVVSSTLTGDLTVNAINPDYLSNKADADLLASELNAGQAFEPVLKFGGVQYPADETRRAWAITLVNGRVATVGTLLKEKNKAGVGAPGRWSDLANPQWIADPQTTVEANLLPEIPIPCRELLPDEVLAQVLPVGWVVQRRALAQKLSDTDLIGPRVREIWQKVVGADPLLLS